MSDGIDMDSVACCNEDFDVFEEVVISEVIALFLEVSDCEFKASIVLWFFSLILKVDVDLFGEFFKDVINCHSSAQFSLKSELIFVAVALLYS